MTDKQKLKILVTALESIIDARDFHSDHGKYPPGLLQDQCFDDWAADVACGALNHARIDSCSVVEPESGFEPDNTDAYPGQQEWKRS